eukprot:81086_1
MSGKQFRRHFSLLQFSKLSSANQDRTFSRCVSGMLMPKSAPQSRSPADMKRVVHFRPATRVYRSLRSASFLSFCFIDWSNSMGDPDFLTVRSASGSSLKCSCRFHRYISRFSCRFREFSTIITAPRM